MSEFKATHRITGNGSVSETATIRGDFDDNKIVHYFDIGILVAKQPCEFGTIADGDIEHYCTDSGFGQVVHNNDVEAI